MKIKINWDLMGIITSVACAIHCALLPVLITSLPILGIDIIHNSFFEWSMIGIAFAVGIYSLLHGYIRHHHQPAPIFIFSLGFCFLILKQVFHDHEVPLLSVAVVGIIGAHYYNYRLCHQSKCSSPHHQH